MPGPYTLGLSIMPPCATTRPLESITHSQFCDWLSTIRRPPPLVSGTCRLSQRLRQDTPSRQYVGASSVPVCAIFITAWNLTVAALVIIPTLPSTGPALQPR